MAAGHPNVKNRKQEVQEVYLRDAYVYLFLQYMCCHISLKT